MALAALHGVLHIRAFADVDSKARLEGVKALIAVREEFRGIVDIQVVAFAQDGIVKEPGAERLMEEAMALGADVVGGIPWIEFTDDDARAHIAFCFDLAAKHDADVSMLLDDAGDPSLRTLEMFATETLRRRMERAGARPSLPRHGALSDALSAAAVGRVAQGARSPSSPIPTPARCTRG